MTGSICGQGQFVGGGGGVGVFRLLTFEGGKGGVVQNRVSRI